MRLTRKRAILLSIELWTWLAETGGEKEDWPGWETNGGQHPECYSDCFLCEYSNRQLGGYSPVCPACPYCAVYGKCYRDDAPYDKWDLAETVEERKQYAQEFLEELKKL